MKVQLFESNVQLCTDERHVTQKYRCAADVGDSLSGNTGSSTPNGYKITAKANNSIYAADCLFCTVLIVLDELCKCSADPRNHKVDVRSANCCYSKVGELLFDSYRHRTGQLSKFTSLSRI